jgi:hypothetical protein
MFRIVSIAIVLWAGVAAADPHAEMAAALAAQVDIHPAAAMLPGVRVPSVRGPSQHASVEGLTHGQQGQANAAANQAQAAANAAAAQQRAADGKKDHPPHPPHP